MAASKSLIAEAQEHAHEFETGSALDATLIGAVQKTEHYCIAAREHGQGLRRRAGREGMSPGRWGAPSRRARASTKS